MPCFGGRGGSAPDGARASRIALPMRSGIQPSPRVLWKDHVMLNVVFRRSWGFGARWRKSVSNCVAHAKWDSAVVARPSERSCDVVELCVSAVVEVRRPMAQERLEVRCPCEVGFSRRRASFGQIMCLVELCVSAVVRVRRPMAQERLELRCPFEVGFSRRRASFGKIM